MAESGAMEDPVKPEGSGADPLLGRVLAGQYHVESRIGAGAMGVVYRARHALLHQDFAVKVLSAKLASDSEARRRFLAEAKVLTGIVHPAVVQVRHFGEEDGFVYLVMDLCGGETLQALLAREGVLSAPRAAGIAVRILEALEVAHAQGVVHRDLKPANVMVNPGSDAAADVRVLDFGLARILEPRAGTSSDLFASSHTSIVGTVSYMAPEQLQDTASVDGRCDLFSVGVLLYEMLSGKRPFEGDSTISVALKILRDGAPPLCAPGSMPSLSSALELVVTRALEKDPARRFPSAGAFAEALRAAVSGGIARVPDAASPPPPEGRPARSGSSRRTRRRRRLLAALALVAITAATWGGIRWRHGSDVAATRAKARDDLEKGYLDKAVEGFGLLIAGQDASGEDYLLRGEALTEMRDAEAVHSLDRANESSPGPRVLLAQAAAIRLLPVEGKEAKLKTLHDKLFAARLNAGDLYEDLTVERVRLSIALHDYGSALNDVSGLEKRSPASVQVPLLRALVEIDRAAEATAKIHRLEGETEASARRSREDLEIEMRTVAERALAEAEKAALDPDLAEAPLLAAQALGFLEGAERRRGDEAAWKGFARRAEAQLDEAIRRAERRPAYHAQGRALARYCWLFASRRDSLRDHAGAIEPARRAWERHPTTEAFHLYAEELMSSGRYEEALKAYGSPEASADENAPFRIAFCHQRMGLRAAERGDDSAALKAYQAALAEYGAEIERKGLDGQPADGDLAYAAETHVWRASLPRGDSARGADLSKAQALFERMPKTSDPSALERRSEYHTARGEHVAALEDIRTVVAGRPGLPFLAYRRYVRCLLDVAEDLAASRKDEAIAMGRQAVQEAESLPSRQIPEQTEAHLLEAEALTRLARIGAGSAEGAEAASSALAKVGFAEAALPAAGVDPVLVARLGAEVRHARATAHLARGDAEPAYGEARAAVDLREAEVQVKRWIPDPQWYDDLADAARKAGHAEEAQSASARARELRGR